jgi:hypothetical protein
MDVYLPPGIQLGSSLQLEQAEGHASGHSSGRENHNASSNGSSSSDDSTGSVAAAQPAFPIVLFCHGGVWASGAKWHYAPLATRLAQAGVVTAVMQVRAVASAGGGLELKHGCVRLKRTCLVLGSNHSWRKQPTNRPYAKLPTLRTRLVV